MPRILFLPDGRVVHARSGETLLEAALRAGVPHAHACGGNARCSTCRVVVFPGGVACGPRTPGEQVLAERLRLPPEVRLACQTRVETDLRVRRMVLDEEDVNLARARGESGALGEERELAILFADLRGFTAFAEDLPPYDVIHVLHRFFQGMGRIVSRYGGRIDNTMGDGLLALFGLDDEPDFALQAVRAGLAMIAHVAAMAPYLRNFNDRPLRLGVGAHYGVAVVGSLGCGAGARVTAIGDAVNFASRVESATRQTGAGCLVTASMREALAGRCRLGRVFHLNLPGKSGRPALYEVLDA